MSETLLKNQIITWLEGQQYWLQYAGNYFLEGGEINDELINTTYDYCKVDFNLKEDITNRASISFNRITTSSSEIVNAINLQEIKNIENVNALATGQNIEINKNLTIIYGDNGSGKSGYIRMLNNTFNSRGDKKILGNVFKSENTPNPKCDFVFQSPTEKYEKTFPKNEGCFEFSLYSVFDTQSIKVHLDGENQLNFAPKGFDFFDRTLAIFERLKLKLQEEIKINRLVNNFAIYFEKDSYVGNIVLSISANTDIKELIELGTIREDDKNKLNEIEIRIQEIKHLKIQEQILKLEKLNQELIKFIPQQQLILNHLSKEEIENCLQLVANLNQLTELTKEDGIKSLKGYNIELVSSNEWRDFILASKKYVSMIESKRGKDLHYPSNDDFCIFCLQPLGDAENKLINTYWTFLRSEVEKELNRTKQKIKDKIKTLRELQVVKFDETLSLYDYLKALNPPLILKWKTIVELSEKARINLIQCLDDLNTEIHIQSFTENANEFDKIVIFIQDEISKLFNKNFDQEIKSLNQNKLVIQEREKLSQLLPQISTLISNYKWASNAEANLTAFKTNSVTIFNGSLFNQHISDEYVTIFNEECRLLNAPYSIDISQHNSKAKTFRRLSVANHTASQILSEGEQRAISLADFLSEVQLNPSNRGVIFDDPVSSLDHQRKSIIAKRLVELSITKQVIIFTHDISFFVKLSQYAENIENISYSKTTIRKTGNLIGLIKPELPWVAQKVKDRIAYLRNSLEKLKKIEKEGNDDEYNMQIKLWYGLLREAWERCVEERLFKGAVERFSGEIHTKPLKRIEVTDELVEMIDTGMTEASNWVHDQAMNLNPQIPNTSKAEQDLAMITSFSDKCKIA